MSTEVSTARPGASSSRPRSNGSNGNASAAVGALRTGKVSVQNGVTLYEPTFAPRVKHPVFDVNVTLVTEAAFRVFQSTYDPAQKALYHLFCTMPILLRENQRLVAEVHGIVEKRFTEIEAALSDETERLRHLAKTDGAGHATRYSNQEPLVVVVLTPAMSRYLALINSMDTVVKTVDALWFATRMKETERNQKMMEWRNRITKFHRELHLLHMRLLGAVDRKGGPDAAAIASGEEGDLAGAEPIVDTVSKPAPKPRKQRKVGADARKAGPVRVTQGTPEAAAAATA